MIDHEKAVIFARGVAEGAALFARACVDGHYLHPDAIDDIETILDADEHFLKLFLDRFEGMTEEKLATVVNSAISRAENGELI